MRRSFAGNDIIDLIEPLRREHFSSVGGSTVADPDWIAHHLTRREQRILRKGSDVFADFWKIFAAKEASWKALAQMGVRLPYGSYHSLEVDDSVQQLVCLPTGHRAAVVFPNEDRDKIHCIATLEAGATCPQWGVDEIPPRSDPSDLVREKVLTSLAAVRGLRVSALAIGDKAGIPKILERGQWRDWSVSLSHSGRFVAFSYIVD